MEWETAKEEEIKLNRGYSCKCCGYVFKSLDDEDCRVCGTIIDDDERELTK